MPACEAVLQRHSDVLFGDRAQLLEAVKRNPDLRVLSRRYTFAASALRCPGTTTTSASPSIAR
jgi:hypothetical protein